MGEIELPPISSEQQNIIDVLSEGFNIQVDAVAGSGKTTTSLYIAKTNPDKSILLLTYNAKLKAETREKVNIFQITNMEVHSYHAFCVKYLNHKAYTDTGIIAFLKQHDTKNTLKPFNYDIIIVDESQDMNPLYYELVLHILLRLKQPPQLVVMGDRKQSIYAFNNADSRFLTKSSQIFKNDRQWRRCLLNISYRLTTQMTDFLNNCCQGSLPITAVKNNKPVNYIICNNYGQRPYREIKHYISLGYTYGDIFILSPSVKSSQSPVRHLANSLSAKAVPVYVPTNDDERLDEDVLVGKIVFSTFHQVKGLERKVVIVFCFDMSYFDFYAKDVPMPDRTSIPNTLYVAITRARERLSIIHSEDNEYLPFLMRDKISNYCNLEVEHSRLDFKTKQSNKNNNNYEHLQSVVQLLKYVPVDVLDNCIKYLKITEIQKPKKLLDIPLKTYQVKNGLCESVCDITGTAIPCYFEYNVFGKVTIFENMMNKRLTDPVIGCGKCLLSDNDSTPSYDETFYQDIAHLDENCCRSLLTMANQYIASETGYEFKINQITQYDWLKPDVLHKAISRLNKVFTEDTRQNLIFELPVEVKFQKYNIHGQLDIYDTKTHNIYELKVVNELSHEHFLQVALYGWLCQQSNWDSNNMYVINILNNQICQISASFEEISQIVQLLIDYKEQSQIKKSDKDFLLKCLKIRKVLKLPY